MLTPVSPSAGQRSLLPRLWLQRPCRAGEGGPRCCRRCCCPSSSPSGGRGDGMSTLSRNRTSFSVYCRVCEEPTRFRLSRKKRETRGRESRGKAAQTIRAPLALRTLGRTKPYSRAYGAAVVVVSEACADLRTDLLPLPSLLSLRSSLRPSLHNSKARGAATPTLQSLDRQLTRPHKLFRTRSSFISSPSQTPLCPSHTAYIAWRIAAHCLAQTRKGHGRRCSGSECL